MTYLVASSVIVIQRRTPGRLVTVGEVRTEFGEVVPFRTDVVINNVEDDGEALLMTGIDELLQANRTAVAALCSVWKHAVVSPVSIAGKLRDGHKFDCGDAELNEIIESRNDRLERAPGRESARMHFVDDVVLQRNATPVFIGPRKIRGDDFTGTVDAFRLETG